MYGQHLFVTTVEFITKPLGLIPFCHSPNHEPTLLCNRIVVYFTSSVAEFQVNWKIAFLLFHSLQFYRRLFSNRVGFWFLLKSNTWSQQNEHNKCVFCVYLYICDRLIRWGSVTLKIICKSRWQSSLNTEEWLFKYQSHIKTYQIHFHRDKWLN